jgi:Domain of unknown function (DUF2382)
MTSDEFHDTQIVDAAPTILTEEVFSLLAERLRIDLTRRKIGEIVVRKEIATQIIQVQVPVRREKLIVEQVSPEYQLLAEIDLDQNNSADLALLQQHGSAAAVNRDLSSVDSQADGINHRTQPHDPTTVYGEIYSPQAASDLLTELASLPNQDWEIVRIEIVLKDAKHQDVYQALVDRYHRV